MCELMDDMGLLLAYNVFVLDDLLTFLVTNMMFFVLLHFFMQLTLQPFYLFVLNRALLVFNIEMTFNYFIKGVLALRLMHLLGNLNFGIRTL